MATQAVRVVKRTVMLNFGLMTSFGGVAPLAPLNVQGSATFPPAEVTLTWEDNPDNPNVATEYKVFRDGVTIATIDTTTFIDTDDALEADTAYDYTVAIKSNGRWSLPSAPTGVAIPNLILPSAPANLVGTWSADGVVSLTWDESTEGSFPIDNYEIFRDGVSFGFGPNPPAPLGIAYNRDFVLGVRAFDTEGNGSATTTINYRHIAPTFDPITDSPSWLLLDNSGTGPILMKLNEEVDLISKTGDGSDSKEKAIANIAITPNAIQDMECSAKVLTVGEGTLNALMMLAVRMSGYQNFIAVRSYNGHLELYERIDGTFNQLDASVPNSEILNQVVKLKVVGSTITVSINDVVKYTKTTALTKAGQVGILDRMAPAHDSTSGFIGADLTEVLYVVDDNDNQVIDDEGNYVTV